MPCSILFTLFLLFFQINKLKCEGFILEIGDLQAKLPILKLPIMCMVSNACVHKNQTANYKITEIKRYTIFNNHKIKLFYFIIIVRHGTCIILKESNYY